MTQPPKNQQEAIAHALARAQQNKARQLQHQRERAARKKKITLLLGLTVASSIALAVVIVNPFSSPPASPPVPEKPAASTIVAETATAAQLERKRAIDSAVEKLRGKSAKGRLKKLLQSALDADAAMQGLWDQKKFTEAAAKFNAVSDAMEKVDLFHQNQDWANNSRDAAIDIVAEAELKGTEPREDRDMAEAVRLIAQAQREFDREDYEHAAGNWQDAGKLIAKALSQTHKRDLMEVARRKFLHDLTARFDRPTLAKHGGGPWTKMSGMLSAIDADIAVGKYDQAKAKVARAGDLIRDLNHQVELSIGGHYYAVLCGYRAADLLLVKAANKTISPKMLDPLRAALVNVGVSNPDTMLGQIAADAPFAKLSQVLLESVPAAVKSARGEEVSQSVEVGVQIRLLERLVANADEAKQSLIETRRSITVMKTAADTLHYPPAFGEFLDTMTKKLAVRPEFEAMLQSQAAMGDFVRKLLEDFDEGMKYFPRT